MNPRYIGWAGGAIIILALVGGALWQANRLIAIGVENGELKARVADLEQALAAQQTTCREVIADLEEGVAYCEERVSTAEGIGEIWKRKYDELSGRPPTVVRVPVEIHETECAAALVEAQIEVGAVVAAMVEEVRDGGI